MSLVVPFLCPSVVIRSRFSSRARVLPSFYVMCSATGGRLQAAIAQISEKEYHTQLRKAYPPSWPSSSWEHMRSRQYARADRAGIEEV